MRSMRGFTLVELLVAIMILTLFMTASMGAVRELRCRGDKAQPLLVGREHESLLATIGPGQWRHLRELPS